MPEIPSREAARFRDTGLFMLLWVVWFLLLLFAQYLLIPLKPDLAGAYWISAVLELLLLAPAAAFILLRHISLSSLFGRAGAMQILLAALAGALIVPVSQAISAFWILILHWIGGGAAIVQPFVWPQTAGQFFAALAAMGICAPLAEESVMRGLALGGSAGRLGRNQGRHSG
jgi:membrane protease YdiL (CAAX protease family)